MVGAFRSAAIKRDGLLRLQSTQVFAVGARTPFRGQAVRDLRGFSHLPAAHRIRDTQGLRDSSRQSPAARHGDNPAVGALER